MVTQQRKIAAGRIASTRFGGRLATGRHLLNEAVADAVSASGAGLWKIPTRTGKVMADQDTIIYKASSLGASHSGQRRSPRVPAKPRRLRIAPMRPTPPLGHAADRTTA
jgi:hypothetical protein